MTMASSRISASQRLHAVQRPAQPPKPAAIRIAPRRECLDVVDRLFGGGITTHRVGFGIVVIEIGWRDGRGLHRKGIGTDTRILFRSVEPGLGLGLQVRGHGLSGLGIVAPFPAAAASAIASTVRRTGASASAAAISLSAWESSACQTVLQRTQRTFRPFGRRLATSRS
jgi:hypothetical protein